MRSWHAGDLVKFRRGRVAHIVGRSPAGRRGVSWRTACGQPISLEDLPALPSDPTCRACDQAPPTQRPLRAL